MGEKQTCTTPSLGGKSKLEARAAGAAVFSVSVQVTVRASTLVIINGINKLLKMMHFDVQNKVYVDLLKMSMKIRIVF